MATIGHIRGILLEEAVLYLLQASGYRTVPSAGTDPTLNDGSAGLEVHGRGAKHQIDAVADFYLVSPFTYKQRLLVEAKCLRSSERVGLPIVRSAAP